MNDLDEKITRLVEFMQVRPARLEKRASLSQGQIGRLMSGERKSPRFDTMVAIADAAGISLDYFRDNYESFESRIDPQMAVFFANEWPKLAEEQRAFIRMSIELVKEGKGKKQGN